MIAFGMLSIYWVGTFSNIIILLVFFKAGLSSSTNICFFYLAIADLEICVSNLITNVCTCMYYKFTFHTSICFLSPNGPMENVRGIIDESFISLTAWITAVICWERLCCIALPMKVRFFRIT